MKSKILTILLSVAIALVLWAYVVTTEYTQMEKRINNIQVQFLGITTLHDRGLMTDSNSGYTVDLKISGKRSDINKLSSSDITVTANLANISEPGEKYITYEVSFPGDLGNGRIEIVDRSSESVKVNVVRRIESNIPVEVEFVGELPENYLVGDYTVSHSSVYLAGPEQWLQQIRKGKIKVNLSGRTETFDDSVKLELCDKDGTPFDSDMDMKSVTVSNEYISVTVPVLMRKEIQLLLPILDGGGLTASDVKVNMSAESVVVMGSPAVIKGLPDSVKLGEINLGEETGSFIDREYQIPLGGSFTVEGNQGMKIKVTLTMPEMTDKKIVIPAKQIEIIGVPTGYTATVNSNLTITVRCMKADENQVDASDLRVVVDVAGSHKDGYFTAVIQAKNNSDVGVYDAIEKVNIVFIEDAE